MPDAANTMALPSELEPLYRLGSIFTPYARAKSDALYGRSGRFVHYTSADSGIKIISSKRLWMRSTTCMADYREVEHGHQLLVSFFSDRDKRNSFIAAIENVAAGAATEALSLFDQWWTHIRFNTYIASIAEHEDAEDLHGRLSMWRAFGGTARVALVVRIPFYSGGGDKLNLTFSPVAYMNEAQVHDEMKKIIHNITSNADFLKTFDKSVIVSHVFQMLLTAATCLKHEGFSEEREWRAIYIPKLKPSPLMKEQTVVIGGVPQRIFEIPLDVSFSADLVELDIVSIFDRLIVGPSAYPWAMYEAFTDVLTKAGVADAHARVRVSEIPIRA